MKTFIDKLVFSILKTHLRYDLKQTQVEYSKLGNVLYFGVGLIALAALLTVPDFEYKSIVYFYTAYCFFVVAFNKLYPPGFSLNMAVLQIPLGVMMIVSLQWLMPLEMVYFTAFLFPIVFVFAYEFHIQLYIKLMLMLAVVATFLIGLAREIPHLEAYLITTFGATVLIGLVVRKAAEKMEYLANFDSLTGLMSRRHWEESLNYELHTSAKAKIDLTVVYIDLDDFKQVNDALGHAQGDMLLQDVAKSIQQVCRPGDLAGRWGGDEFAIAMPNTSSDTAHRVVEALKQLMPETAFSVGVVSVMPEEAIEQLLIRADKAMYQIKSERKQ